MEEGIKSYNRKLYSEILDVINSVLPAGDSNSPAASEQQSVPQGGMEGATSERQNTPEEIKGYHQKQMHAWKNERRNINMRGAGANRDPMHHNSYYGQ